MSAAKIHVLCLEPLKSKLGPKWERLSGLVHKLFETAIVGAQSSADQYVLLDELSYAVVFNTLPFEDAERICNAIAKEVCQSLFGEQIDEVSVRSVVANVVAPSPFTSAQAGRLLEAMVERHGSESVFTQSTQSGSREPVAVVESRKLQPAPLPREQIAAAHKLAAKSGVRMGFFPVWELQRYVSSALQLSLFSGWANRPTAIGKAFPDEDAAEQIATLEIALLEAAVAHATRIAECNKVCAVCVAVSYKTLSVFKLRIRYITALQRTAIQPSTPLVLVISQIPEGTPALRIGELAAMMKFPSVRVILEFQSLQALPEFDFQLSAAGLGGGLPKWADQHMAAHLMRKLVHAGQLHKAFTFLSDLDSPEMVELARRSNVRFGTGTALGQVLFSGLEDIPDFPLMLDQSNFGTSVFV